MIAMLSVIALAAAIGPFNPASAPGLCAGDSAPEAQVALASRVGLPLKATCSALCGSAPSVMCTGTTCSGFNRNCPSERGHVTCTTGSTVTTINCPACETCTEGSFKTVNVGPTCGSEDGQSTPKDRYQCINNEWVYQFSFCGAPFCPQPLR